MKNRNNKKDIATNTELIGYCKYCKCAVYQEEEYVKKNGSVYHLDCYNQKNDRLEELNF